MLCKKPFVKGMQVYGCGRCMPCRVRKRQEWTHRIVLEAKTHVNNTFATLTYAEDKSDLNPAELRDFLKRLRYFVAPTKIRFFAVGEYGDINDRPHYHLALFNYPNCEYGTSRYEKGYKDCCKHCDLIRKTWGLGHIYLGELNETSARYTAGYVTKKMTSPDDPRLKGRHPEFARASNRPGIGANFIREIALAMGVYAEELPDVPFSIAHGERPLPLGRYLRNRLRKELGRPENTPPEALEEWEESVRAMYEAAYLASDFIDIGRHYVKENTGKLRQIEAKAKIAASSKKGKQL